MFTPSTSKPFTSKPSMSKGNSMKTTTRLLLIALLSLPMLAACNKEAEKPAVVDAPLSAPKTSDEAAWSDYLSDVIKRNANGATNLYGYTLPAPDSPDFQGSYDRQLEAATGGVSRGGVEGTIIAFGSPSSAKSADLAVSAFSVAQAASMKGVVVLFIGDAADSARVEAAVVPSGATYRFVQVK